MSLNNLAKATKEIFDFYRKNHDETIPIEIFIKKIELEFKVRLSDESKEEILNEICSRENVSIIIDKFGKKVIKVD